MIKDRATIRFTKKAYENMSYLVGNNKGSVSSIINQAIENIDIKDINNIHNKNDISQAYVELMNLIGEVSDTDLRHKIYKEMEVMQCLWLK